VRVTVCELPHDPSTLAAAWTGLCQHTARHRSELVLLPEFAMVDPVWEGVLFDPARWAAAEALSELWLNRLDELRAAHVVGTRPVSKNGKRYNEGYIWSGGSRVVPLRRKYFLPAESGNWETHWFERGDPDFPTFHAGPLSFGLNICTELWALDTYASYAERDVQVILSPRATGAATTHKWLSVGVVAAVRSGAFSLSSNRVDPTGACGGVGWIISPDGKLLASTSPDAPFVTMDIDLAAAEEARDQYPRYVFSEVGVA
jgi:N-carbamoylputrescine amidase